MQSIKKNGSSYLMEFAGLAGFVLLAGLLTIFLEHPDLAVRQGALKDHAFLRRIPLGIILGIYIAVVVLAFGKKSGAHINPAVTWTFYRLGKINFTDAWLYTIAQFAGAVGGAHLLKYTLGDWFGHPLINYGNTAPQPPHGSLAAFTAEFIISFILMLVVLMASSSQRWEKYVAPLSGGLIALYLMIEIPFSGMSLNPARSFAGSLAANQWEHLWIYFVAPPLAMLAASEVFISWQVKQADPTKQLSKTKSDRPDYQEIPHYPVAAAS